jgi:hypothetical protein
MGIAFIMGKCMDIWIWIWDFLIYCLSLFINLTRTPFSHVYSSCTDQRTSGHHYAWAIAKVVMFILFNSFSDIPFEMDYGR